MRRTLARVGVAIVAVATLAGCYIPGQTTTAPPDQATAEKADQALKALQGQVLSKGPVLAVDQTATAYALQDADTELLARLGYAPGDVAPVPQAWTELLRSGPVLGSTAARTEVSGGS